MKLRNTLSMRSPFIHKALFSLMKAVTSPRSTVSWVLRGHLARDPVYVNHTYWFTGTLPRVSLVDVMPRAGDLEIVLPRAFDRTSGKTASISVEEACYLGAIAKCIKARRALEIGTYDGNTALVLAANLPANGEVVTVDLPPDFSIGNQSALTYQDGEFNLTARDQLGRQYRGHQLSSRIRQVYGDSGALDWNALGGPFDIVFIDGCHTEAYVESDSQHALKHVAPGGAIVWHDYGMIPEVSRVVDRLAHDVADLKVYALEGTRLALGLTQA